MLTYYSPADIKCQALLKDVLIQSLQPDTSFVYIKEFPQSAVVHTPVVSRVSKFLIPPVNIILFFSFNFGKMCS